MLDEQNNEDVLPALLSDGEAVIPENYNLDAVSDLIKDYISKVDQTEDTEEIPVEEPVVEEVRIEDTTKPVKVEAKAEPKKKAKVVEESEKIIAVFSTKNVTWNGVGKVNRGYNIVTQEEADKWVTRDHIRLATPQEVAREYGL